MTQDTDMLIDRRRLKRRLTIWRVLAIVAIVVAVIAGAGRFRGVDLRDHVARLDIEGIILADPTLVEALSEVAANSRTKALIVRIESPGGTFVGGETLFQSLRAVAEQKPVVAVAEQKPVVAVMGTVATSAGYMTAIAADRIFAHEGTITGSIGVILQTTDITELLGKIGISAEAIKSAPLKATPSPLEPLSEESRAAVQTIIDDMHALFTAMVAERRGLDADRARALADGRIYTGRQALRDELVDAIGGEVEARDWLAAAMEISVDLPTREVEFGVLDKSWFPDVSSVTENLLFSERLTLDGLVSVWQP